MTFRLTASIGIMLFKDSNHKIDELMKFADTAMYNAKEKVEIDTVTLTQITSYS